MAEALAKKREFITLADSPESKDKLFLGAGAPQGYVWQELDLPLDQLRAEEEAQQFIERITLVVNEEEDQPTIGTPTLRNLPVGLNPPVIPVARSHHERDQFTLLQKWEGVVTDIGSDSFTGRLTDLTNEGPDEEVELSIEEIPDPDRNLIERGAIFYWYIGYLDTESKQRIRASIIRFRRLPVWTDKELDAAKAAAQSLRELLDRK